HTNPVFLNYQNKAAIHQLAKNLIAPLLDDMSCAAMDSRTVYALQPNLVQRGMNAEAKRIVNQFNSQHDTRIQNALVVSELTYASHSHPRPNVSVLLVDDKGYLVAKVKAFSASRLPAAKN